MNNTTISKLCKVITSYQARPSCQGQPGPHVKYLQLKTNTDYIIDFQRSNESCYEGIKHPIEHYALQLEDIVVDKQLNVGIVLTLPDIPVLPNQNQYIVRIQYSNYLPEYVACYLSLKSLKRQLRGKISTGVLTIETLREVVIPNLTLKQQEKVVEVCNQIRDYKQLAQKAIDKMELIPYVVINKLIKNQ